MSIQKHIVDIENGLSKLKDELYQDYAISMHDQTGELFTYDVCELSEMTLRSLTPSQINKIEDFCRISEGRYMRFGDFVSNLKLINQLENHELSKGIVSHTLLTLLFIQDDIDNFEPISLGVLDV